jgi:excisionase family DNA binding protein
VGSHLGNFVAYLSGEDRRRQPVASDGPHILVRRPVISLVMVDQMLTADEVARMLRISLGTLYKLVRKGKIPAFRIGIDWRFSREAIEKWMQQGEHNS